MEWTSWFGQMAGFVVGAFSLLWLIGAGFVLLVKALLRNEYTFERVKARRRLAQ